jgi:hypothetical protein
MTFRSLLLSLLQNAHFPQTHELELEFISPDEMKRLLELKGREGPETYGYDQLVAVFVNNCRILSRNVLKPSS